MPKNSPIMTVVSPTLLSIPVSSSRVWTTALSPNGDGTWNYIVQEAPLHKPTRWVVVNLWTGSYTYGLAEGAANHTGVGSNNQPCHVSLTLANQKRAANGRIFFPCAKNNLAYYDPIDRLVHALPQLADASYSPEHEASGYTHEFGSDGVLYIGSQTDSAPPWRPCVYSVDTTANPPSRTIIGHAGGVNARTSFSYCYYLQPDTTQPTKYLYICVGKSPWELICFDIATGAQTSLLPEPVDGNGTLGGLGYMSFSINKHVGLLCTIHHDLGKPDDAPIRLWCADGRTYPYEDPSFPHRDVTSPIFEATSPPDIDDSAGVGLVKWRPYGSTAPFVSVTYAIANADPIPIESMLPLDDGTLLGNVQEYLGFFRYHPSTGATDQYGALNQNKVSKPALLRSSIDELVYIAGYPNGVLFAYDPAVAWDNAGGNPSYRGHFSASDMKYTHDLVEGGNGRIYASGRRERDGVGSGIGYYTIATGEFGGTHAKLNFLTARGLAVFKTLRRVVFSGAVNDDPSSLSPTPESAQLVLFDLDLIEIGRQTVADGLRDTGVLYRTTEPSVVVGLSASGSTLYRYDIGRGALLERVKLAPRGDVGASSQRADGWIVAILGSSLVSINPYNLSITAIGDLSAAIATYGGITELRWSKTTRVGDSEFAQVLYVSAGANLLRTTVSLSPMVQAHLAPPEASS